MIFLEKPPAMPVIINTTGKLDPPLGSIRLKVLDLLAALVSIGDPVADKKIIEHRALSVCFDLFFKYEWCNLLHNTVKAMVEGILSGDRERMKKCVIEDCKLLSRIVFAHQHDAQGTVRSKGYTGHLRLISNRIEELAESEEWLGVHVKGDAWRAFVTGTLQASNEINDRKKLGESTVSPAIPYTRPRPPLPVSAELLWKATWLIRGWETDCTLPQDTGRDLPHSLDLDLGDATQPSSFEFRVNLLNEQLFATDGAAPAHPASHLRCTAMARGICGLHAVSDWVFFCFADDGDVEGVGIEEDIEAGPSEEEEEQEVSSPTRAPTRGKWEGAESPKKSPSKGSPQKPALLQGSPKKNAGPGKSPSKGGAGGGAEGLLAQIFINLSLVDGKAVASVKVAAV